MEYFVLRVETYWPRPPFSLSSMSLRIEWKRSIGFYFLIIVLLSVLPISVIITLVCCMRELKVVAQPCKTPLRQSIRPTWRPYSLSCVFVWSRIYFDAFRPSVHTKTLSVFNETAPLGKRSRNWIQMKTRTHRHCENRYENGSVTENGAKGKLIMHKSM